MGVKTIFDLCEPRRDVVKGDIAKSDFAADLAQVIKGTASGEYLKPELFFGTTYPTRGLKSLLANVCARLSGKPGEVAAIFRLGTSFGGGKTHALIALVHAANGMRGVTNAAEFIDPAVVPKGRVRVAAFDGENADPANGRKLGDDILAFTPWGEIAYALAGRAGYERVRRGDEQDGWFGVSVTPDQAKAKIERMRQYAQAAGRDPGKLHFSVSSGIGAPIGLDEVKRYRDAGVHQVVVGTIPRDPKTVQADVERLADKIVVPAARF